MEISLKDKVVLITGAGSGIGESMASTFAAAGAIVHVMDVHAENGNRVAKEIHENGGVAHFHLADVKNQAEIKQCIATIIETSSRVDILINNAGVAHIGNLENTSEVDFDKVYDVNVKGVYNCMYTVIDQMKKQRSGVIINMASIASHMGLPDRFVYSMSKGAVLSMTYCVARDYLDFNIRCNSISPGRVHTPFVDGFLKNNYPGREKEMLLKLAATQPIGRMGMPKEIAELALFLASDKASFITGTDFPIDGGFIKLNT